MSLAEYNTLKEYLTFFRMEATKRLLKQPETHYSKGLAPAPDIEGGMKKEKKDLKTRIIILHKRISAYRIKKSQLY